MIRSRSFQLNNDAGNDDHSREIKTELPRLKISVGADIHVLAKDREILTDPEETRRRRAIRLVRSKANSWGFTLQTYGIRNKRTKEVEVMSYVDYVEINGPAWVAGMRRGDIILSVNGESVEAATHNELVNKIKRSGHELRLVVLFEDCCTKVELHERYLKLKKLLSGKLRELRHLEEEERKLNHGSPLSRLDSFRQSTSSSLCSDWDSYSLITSDGLDQIVANKFVSRAKYSDLSELSSNGSIPSQSICDVSIDSSVTDPSINYATTKIAESDALNKPFLETEQLTSRGVYSRGECATEEIDRVNIQGKELENASKDSIPCQDNVSEALNTELGIVADTSQCPNCCLSSCCCFIHLSPEPILDDQSLSETRKKSGLYQPDTAILDFDISKDKIAVKADLNDSAVVYGCVESAVSGGVESGDVSSCVNSLLNVDLCPPKKKHITGLDANNIESATVTVIVNSAGQRKDMNWTTNQTQAVLESKGDVHTVPLKSEQEPIDSITVEDRSTDDSPVPPSFDIRRDKRQTRMSPLYGNTTPTLNTINEMPSGTVTKSSTSTCDKTSSIPPENLVDGILVNDTTLSTRL
ncbi:unnamed protein product [Lymnaea stagnalis]|uniref:PDZ domain-containing protein n=1 Tax=Lymnaea stagnalis TaxID=6523 RepID=A0AAV2IHY0_LYMST